MVLFFYPKDNTPVCTAESCAFRDEYEGIVGTDAEVIGISGDSTSSHKKFAAKHELPFPLLSDPGRKVARAFGVKATLGIIPGRMTFTIGLDGKVVHVTAARFSARVHVDEAIAALARSA